MLSKTRLFHAGMCMAKETRENSVLCRHVFKIRKNLRCGLMGA